MNSITANCFIRQWPVNPHEDVSNVSDSIQSARSTAHSETLHQQPDCAAHRVHAGQDEPGRESAAQQVLQAADALIEAFGRHDRDAYFAAFSTDASFVFHHVPESLASREAYEDLWHRWERDTGFTVLACESGNRTVRMLDTRAALFTHTVSTTIRTSEGMQTVVERETIVFVLQGGRWLAIHEHLSPFGPDSSSGEKTA